MRLKIYGQDHNVIKVESDTGINETYTTEEGGAVELSTGDIFEVYSSEGAWRVKPLKEVSDVGIICIENVYALASDVLEIHGMGSVKWVEFWENYPPSSKEVLEKITALVKKGDVESDSALRALQELKGDDKTRYEEE